jgi:hypothetical protein
VGCHAAWATAWHNGQQVSYAEAEKAWDSTEDVPLEEKLGEKWGECDWFSSFSHHFFKGKSHGKSYSCG